MKFKLYDSPHQFEPLLPSEFKQGDLLAKAHDVMRSAGELVIQPVPDDLRELLRGMNSYYTNRIEGQHTRPLEIEQALKKDFSHDPATANKQKLALAHMAAERSIEQHLAAHADADTPLASSQLYSTELLCYLHHQLFAQDSIDVAMQDVGVLRSTEVQVGQHVAPTAQSLPAFMARWSQFYGGVRRGEAAVLAVAASHQRFGWIHPFTDGNGRVMRLHTHAMLYAQGLTRGLWSPLRGFARSVDRYYALLSAADEPRHGDLDGRGNLSESALMAWMDYVLDICQDQIQLMRGLLKLSTMEGRIAACLSFEAHTRSGIRMEAIKPLHYLWLGGHSMDRGDFKTMTGLGDRVATSVLTALIQRGLLKSDTPQGKVRFGVPLHALRFYFPSLWPEAEADVAE
jgi:Fic family protein